MHQVGLCLAGGSALGVARASRSYEELTRLEDRVGLAEPARQHPKCDVCGRALAVTTCFSPKRRKKKFSSSLQHIYRYQGKPVYVYICNVGSGRCALLGTREEVVQVASGREITECAMSDLRTVGIRVRGGTSVQQHKQATTAQHRREQQQQQQYSRGSSCFRTRSKGAGRSQGSCS